MSLEGKVVLISGVARGQGRSHALHLASQGAAIVGFDICASLDSNPLPLATEADLEETARQVKGVGGHMVAVVADVRSFDAVSDVVADGVAEFGTINVILGNAAILGERANSWEQSEKVFRDVLDVNVIGVWNTIRAGLAPMLADDRGGSIIVTGSGASVKGLANIAPYVASKHALVGLVHTMARELGPRGVRVNGVLPGNANTDMFHNDAVRKMYLPDLPEHDEEEFLRRAGAGSPMRIPFVEVSDVSEAVAFLAGDASRYITGTLLPVDGGTAIP